MLTFRDFARAVVHGLVRDICAFVELRDVAFPTNPRSWVTTCSVRTSMVTSWTYVRVASMGQAQTYRGYPEKALDKNTIKFMRGAGSMITTSPSVYLSSHFDFSLKKTTPGRALTRSVSCRCEPAKAHLAL